jgi:hypothetical protein
MMVAKRRKGRPIPYVPVPYGLWFSAYLDGVKQKAIVTFPIQCSGAVSLNEKGLAPAAMELLSRDYEAEKRAGFNFKYRDETKNSAECEVELPIDFTIFDIAQRKRDAERFFGTLMDKADEILTMIRFSERSKR